MTIALAVHGGAWNVPDAETQPHLDGIAAALQLGWRELRAGRGAVDVVEAVVRTLEDDPIFNAGRGSHLNRLGRVEMDASLMDGDGLEAGAVAAVQRVRHPISLARRVMDDSPHVLLVGRGARRFAEEKGVELCRSRDLLVGRAREHYLRIRSGDDSLVRDEFSPTADDHMGTVGAVALDSTGRICAGTSTGGTLDKYPGRVGDSPLIGAGTYADSRVGGASCTGWGEGILRVVMAKTALVRMQSGASQQEAADAGLADLARIGGHAGMILVSADGTPGAVFNTPRMARGLASESGVQVGVDAEMRPV